MNDFEPSAASNHWGAFRVREFRIVWVGTLVSNAGSWMQKIVTAWLLYQVTRSEAWLGIDAIASAIPTILLLPLGGVVADRFDRRQILIWANLIGAALSFGLAILNVTGELGVTHIILASIINGTIQAVAVPTVTSLFPDLVGDENLSSAIALQSVQFNLSRIAGPVAGGIVLAYFGATWSFALNALSFVFLAGAFAMLKRCPQTANEAAPIGRSLWQGLKLVRRRPAVAAVLAVITATALLGAPLISMLPAVANNILRQDASTFSVLLSCFGVGAVVASLGVAALGTRLRARRAVTLAVLVLGLCQIQVAMGGAVWLVASVIGLAGLCFVGTMICLGTEILLAVPDNFRGRVSSFQQICFRTAQPLGSLVAGVLATWKGIGFALVCFGMLLLATGLLTPIIWRKTA